MPMAAAPAISTDSMTTAVIPRPRAMNVAAVAQPSAASTKNCHACSCWSLVAGRGCWLLVTPMTSRWPARSVEVAELIVQPRFDVGVNSLRRIGLRFGPARPPDRGKADHERARGARRVGKQPREAVEAFVDRRAKHLFGSVFRNERLDDLVVRLALIDERGELATHLMRRRAIVLAAFGQVLMSAGAAGADNLVLHLLLERRSRVERCARVLGAAHALLGAKR